jgi:hypothetical protein
MSSARSARSGGGVLLGVQRPQLLHLPPDVVSLDAAAEAVEFVSAYGMTLDDSQQFTLSAALGERVDGTWAAFEVADIEPRQNGKGDTIQAREATGMFVFGEGLIIHTAHELKTAVQAFKRMEQFISANADLRRQVKFRYANGEQAVEHRSGARIIYLARTGGAGRGFDEADLVVYDEAYALAAEQMAASLPTMSVAENPQVWYASSAALAHSTMLWSLRLRALRGNDGAMSLGRIPAALLLKHFIEMAGAGGRLAYLEHTAERCRLDEKGDFAAEPVDEDDEANVATANPAYGYRITKDLVDAERAAFSAAPGLFAREILGVFDPLPDVQASRPAKLPAEAWAATVGQPPVEVRPGDITIAYGVTKDSEHASITIAAGDLRRPYVETIEHREGAGWLPQRLVELVEAWDPIAVGCNGAGPAGAQVGPVLAAFRDAGIPAELFHQLSTQEYKRACGGFYTDVVELDEELGRPRLLRPNDAPLTLAGEDAVDRPLGDGWAWASRSGSVPISPIESATVARALLPTERVAATPEPMFAFT